MTDKKKFEAYCPYGHIETTFAVPKYLCDGDVLPPLSLFCFSESQPFVLEGKFEASDDTLVFSLDGPEGYTYKSVVCGVGYDAKSPKNESSGVCNDASFTVPRSAVGSLPPIGKLHVSKKDATPWSFNGVPVGHNFVLCRLELDISPVNSPVVLARKPEKPKKEVPKTRIAMPTETPDKRLKHVILQNLTDAEPFQNILDDKGDDEGKLRESLAQLKVEALVEKKPSDQATMLDTPQVGPYMSIADLTIERKNMPIKSDQPETVRPITDIPINKETVTETPPKRAPKEQKETLDPHLKSISEDLTTEHDVAPKKTGGISDVPTVIRTELPQEATMGLPKETGRFGRKKQQGSAFTIETPPKEMMPIEEPIQEVRVERAEAVPFQYDTVVMTPGGDTHICVVLDESCDSTTTVYLNATRQTDEWREIYVIYNMNVDEYKGLTRADRPLLTVIRTQQDVTVTYEDGYVQEMSWRKEQFSFAHDLPPDLEAKLSQQANKGGTLEYQQVVRPRQMAKSNKTDDASRKRKSDKESKKSARRSQLDAEKVVIVDEQQQRRAVVRKSDKGIKDFLKQYENVKPAEFEKTEASESPTPGSPTSSSEATYETMDDSFVSEVKQDEPMPVQKVDGGKDKTDFVNVEQVNMKAFITVRKPRDETNPVGLEELKG